MSWWYLSKRSFKYFLWLQDWTGTPVTRSPPSTRTFCLLISWQTVQLHQLKKIPRWNRKLVYANMFFYPGIWILVYSKLLNCCCFSPSWTSSFRPNFLLVCLVNSDRGWRASLPLRYVNCSISILLAGSFILVTFVRIPDASCLRLANCAPLNTPKTTNGTERESRACGRKSYR